MILEDIETYPQKLKEERDLTVKELEKKEKEDNEYADKKSQIADSLGKLEDKHENSRNDIIKGLQEAESKIAVIIQLDNELSKELIQSWLPFQLMLLTN